jgi:uncharacterized membrane protein
MRTPLPSILCYLAASFLGALGQFLYKSGADRAQGSIASYANPRILGGVVCYIAVMVLFVAGLKKGGAPATLYPIYATTFIWASVLSYAAYRTPITPGHMVGMALIIAGTALLGR